MQLDSGFGGRTAAGLFMAVHAGSGCQQISLRIHEFRKQKIVFFDLFLCEGGAFCKTTFMQFTARRALKAPHFSRWKLERLRGRAVARINAQMALYFV